MVIERSYASCREFCQFVSELAFVSSRTPEESYIGTCPLSCIVKGMIERLFSGHKPLANI